MNPPRETHDDSSYRSLSDMSNVGIAPSKNNRCTTSHQSHQLHQEEEEEEGAWEGEQEAQPFSFLSQKGIENGSFVTENQVNTYKWPQPSPKNNHLHNHHDRHDRHDHNDHHDHHDRHEDDDVKYGGSCETKWKKFDDSYYSLNQKLVGPPNPKTKHNPPVVPDRLYEKTWSNPFFVPRGINDQKQQEYRQNGYLISDDETQTCPSECVLENNNNIKEPFALASAFSGGGGGRLSSRALSQLSGLGLGPTSTEPPKEVNEIDYPGVDETSVTIENSMFAPMNLSYGYYPQNRNANLPVNMPLSRNFCATPEYNAELRTTPLQPGLVSYSEVNVNDANMSNLGISYTQPMLPTKLVDLAGTDQAFVETDPFWKEHYTTQKKQNETLPTFQSAYTSEPYQPSCQDPQTNGPAMIPRRDIFDPRLTGYGTTYRSYVDPMTGQPRYYYDDVDAHTQYNFITKTKIDHLPRTTQSGPYQEPCMNAMETRRYAEDMFHNQTLQQRTELQDRLMQKILHRNIQRHQAPISTQNTGSMQLTRARG